MLAVKEINALEESKLTNETSVTNTSAPEHITPAEIAKRKREQQNKN